MENNTRGNMRLVGNGTASGGYYQNIKIVGDQIIGGDLDCINMKLTGTCDVQGNVKVKDAKLTGTMDIQGNLETETFAIIGTMNIQQNVAVKEFTICGETHVKGNGSVEKANIFGLLHIAGECNAETFFVKGSFCIGGLLNAGNIEIETHSQCLVKEMGGEKISVRRGTDMLMKKLFRFFCAPKDFYRGQLITDAIEGDDIYLEYTKVKVVRGNNIQIGPGCQIELIEYKNTLEQHRDSVVGKNQKIS